MIGRRKMGAKATSIADRFYTYHAFNGDYKDGKGNAADLIEIGNGTHPVTFINDRFGKLNKAVHFSNVTAGDSGNNTILQTNLGGYSGDLTYSFWLKVDSLVNNIGRPIQLSFNSTTAFENYIGFGQNVTRVISTSAYSTNIQAIDLVGIWTHHLIRSNAVGEVDYFYQGLKIIDKEPLGVGTLAQMILGNGTGGAPYNGAIDDLITMAEFVSDADVVTLMNYNT